MPALIQLSSVVLCIRCLWLQSAW